MNRELIEENKNNSFSWKIYKEHFEKWNSETEFVEQKELYVLKLKEKLTISDKFAVFILFLTIIGIIPFLLFPMTQNKYFSSLAGLKRYLKYKLGDSE